MQKWRGVLKGRMFEHGITNGDVRRKIGVSYAYVSRMFNGKRAAKSAEKRLTDAVDDLIRERIRGNVDE